MGFSQMPGLMGDDVISNRLGRNVGRPGSVALWYQRGQLTRCCGQVQTFLCLGPPALVINLDHDQISTVEAQGLDLVPRRLQSEEGLLRTKGLVIKRSKKLSS